MIMCSFSIWYVRSGSCNKCITSLWQHAEVKRTSPLITIQRQRASEKENKRKSIVTNNAFRMIFMWKCIFVVFCKWFRTGMIKCFCALASLCMIFFLAVPYVDAFAECSNVCVCAFCCCCCCDIQNDNHFVEMPLICSAFSCSFVSLLLDAVDFGRAGTVTQRSATSASRRFFLHRMVASDLGTYQIIMI